MEKRLADFGIETSGGASESPRLIPLTRAMTVGVAVSDLASAFGDVDERTWMVDARCLDADPETFFPEKGGSTLEAKRICADCPVSEPCLEYAVGNDEQFGIWGGLSDRERKRVRRLRG